MKRIIAVCITILLLSNGIYAQDKKLEKKLAKAKEYVNKDKLKDAVKVMEETVEDFPQSGEAWDLFVKIRAYEVEDAKKTQSLTGSIFDNIKITTTDSSGKKLENDSMAASLSKMLKEFSPVKTAERNLIFTCRKATLFSNEALYGNMYLRYYKVDRKIDTSINKKAIKYFNEAEEEFQKKNYDEAAKLYQKAIDKEPGFYKAQLYQGDCYFFLNQYTLAIESFKKAIEKAPDLVEPRKYLTDAYYKEKLYEKAVEEAIACMAVYPDLSMFDKLYDAAYMIGKKLNYEWTKREVFPNSISPRDSYTPADLKDPVPAKNSSWNIYIAALEKAKPYCNSVGIFTEANSLTKSKYLEVYSWEEMLKAAPAEEFQFARKMQEKGYLDCYIMVTCFHQDFYQQYKDFAANNKERIKLYLNLCLETAK